MIDYFEWSHMDNHYSFFAESADDALAISTMVVNSTSTDGDVISTVSRLDGDSKYHTKVVVEFIDGLNKDLFLSQVSMYNEDGDCDLLYTDEMDKIEMHDLSGRRARTR